METYVFNVVKRKFINGESIFNSLYNFYVMLVKSELFDDISVSESTDLTYIQNYYEINVGSDYRYEILLSLKEKIKTPKLISRDTNIQINHVSNILKELGEKGLIKCETPELRKGRIYKITDKGSEIVEKLKKIV